MIGVVGALAPVFLLILFGYGLRRFGFLPEAAWPPLERLTYFVLFPALLIEKLAGAELAGLSVAPMASAMIVTVLAASAALLLIRPRLSLDGPSFTSLFQGSVRPNTYVGLAAAAAVYHASGIALTAIAVAAVIPLVNVLAVLVLTRYASARTVGWRGTLESILKNPIILACLAGILLNATGVGLPRAVAPLLDIVGGAALPLGLLAAGAGLKMRAARAAGTSVLFSCAVKLMVMPFLTWLACLALGVGGMTAAVAVMFNGLPGSVASYVLSRQLGGDAVLMAGILTVQTLLAMVSLPAILILLG